MHSRDVDHFLRNGLQRTLTVQDKQAMLRNINQAIDNLSYQNSTKSTRRVRRDVLYGIVSAVVFTGLVAGVVTEYIGKTNHTPPSLAAGPINSHGAANPRQAVERWIRAIHDNNVTLAASLCKDDRYLSKQDQIDDYRVMILSSPMTTYNINRIKVLNDTNAIVYITGTQSTQHTTESVNVIKTVDGWYMHIPYTQKGRRAPLDTDFTGTSVASNPKRLAPFKALMPKSPPRDFGPRLSNFTDAYNEMVTYNVAHGFKGTSIRTSDVMYALMGKSQGNVRYITIREQPDVGKFVWLSHLKPLTIKGVNVWIDDSRRNMPQLIGWYKGLMINVYGNVTIAQLKQVMESIIN